MLRTLALAALLLVAALPVSAGSKEGVAARDSVPRNYMTAYMWTSLAAAAGNKLAAEYLDIIEKRMTPADVSRAQAMAAKWRPKKARK